MKLIGFFNRDGGTFKTTDMAAYEMKAEQVFRDAGHDFEGLVVSGNEVVAAMERAARRDDIDGIVAGGGDGTISAAAAVAWKNGVALGVIPAGTMNLFARSLRLPLDIWQVLDVLATGEVDHVDIGSANGRPFIHQFSAGLHARMVRYRDAYPYRSRLGKISASSRAALGVVFNPPEFDVDFEAEGGSGAPACLGDFRLQQSLRSQYAALCRRSARRRTWLLYGKAIAAARRGAARH